MDVIPDWKNRIVYSPQAPQPVVLFEERGFKALLAGLEAGQAIPQHPEGSSLYYFLEGSGVMTVDGQPVEVAAGTTLVMPGGAVRGLQARTRLAFLAARLATGEDGASGG